MKYTGIFLLGVSTILLIGLFVYTAYSEIQFERNCEGYLKRAADANTIPLAAEELEKAIAYIERENLDEGSTHAFYATPACDLEFWAKNLKAAASELRALPTDIDSLTASNQLLKLRETLMDHGKKSQRVTAPPNIEVYPYQLPFRVGILGGLVGLLLGLLALSIHSEKCKGTSEGQTESSLG